MQQVAAVIFVEMPPYKATEHLTFLTIEMEVKQDLSNSTCCGRDEKVEIVPYRTTFWVT